VLLFQGEKHALPWGSSTEDLPGSWGRGEGVKSAAVGKDPLHTTISLTPPISPRNPEEKQCFLGIEAHRGKESRQCFKD